MKIVLAASIYPPEIGGPATYAKGLKDALEKMGHIVALEVFSAVKYPSGIRHAIYTWRLIRTARDADMLLAFDVLTTGLPAAIAKRVTAVPTYARIGGDFLWERYVERTGHLVTLPEFYEARAKWGGKERFLFKLISFVLNSIDVAFSSAWQRNLWQRAYALSDARTHVIENAIPERLIAEQGAAKNFLHYGRELALKNSPMLHRAFGRVKRSHPEISLEEGSVPQAELLTRIRKGYAVVLPSLSDVTPNYILDAIRCGTPFLLTKHSAYADRYKDFGVIVDPMSEESIVGGLERLLDPSEYARMRTAIASYTEVRTYEDIAREFLATRDESLSR